MVKGEDSGVSLLRFEAPVWTYDCATLGKSLHLSMPQLHLL